MGIEAIALVASAAGTAISSIYSGISANNQAKAQASLQDQQAAEARDQARVEAERIREATKYRRGQARAALAASGVQVDTGTALQIDDNIALIGEQDAFQTLLTGRRQASAASNEAALLRQGGTNSLIAGGISAANSLLSAGANYSRGRYGRT